MHSDAMSLKLATSVFLSKLSKMCIARWRMHNEVDLKGQKSLISLKGQNRIIIKPKGLKVQLNQISI